MFIRKYLAALWEDWLARMSGGASVALGFWVAYFPPTDIKAGRVLLWFTAGACFVYASYRVWVSEYKKTLALEETAKLKRPMLVGVISDYLAHGYGRPGEPNESKESVIPFAPDPIGTAVALKVRFVNESPIPTTIHNFSLSVKSGDKTHYCPYPEEPSKLETWRPDYISEAEEKKANLASMLDTSKMAVQGEGIEGFLVFYVEGFLPIEFNAGKVAFTVHITDAWGERHDVTKWVPALRPSQRIGYIPHRRLKG